MHNTVNTMRKFTLKSLSTCTYNHPILTTSKGQLRFNWLSIRLSIGMCRMILSLMMTEIGGY